jgi:tripartite-type tricarboxylate transporter receptor subunit TctC
LKKLLSLIASICIFSSASATEFTVYFGPGGVSDRATRVITKHLPENYLVVNRPGAGGRIAISHLQKTESIMLATMSQIYVTNNLMSTPAGYDAEKDLEIIATIGTTPNLLACKKSLGFTEVKDLVGKKLNFGVTGVGTSEHIATATLLTKIPGDHVIVPYSQGGNSAVKDLIGGQLDCTFGNFSTIQPVITSDKITILLASHKLGLGVPTWNDMYGEKFPFQSYLSIVLSSHLDADTKKRIKAEVTTALSNPDIKRELENIGIFVEYATEKQVLGAMKQIRTFINNSNMKIQ